MENQAKLIEVLLVEDDPQDVEITKDLVAIGRVLGIEVLDHIIITKLKHFSFKEKKLI